MAGHRDVTGPITGTVRDRDLKEVYAMTGTTKTTALQRLSVNQRDGVVERHGRCRGDVPDRLAFECSAEGVV